ncbi:MAG: 5'-3' exonuclease H3TH domain-containing protein [Candidatus Wildermuthbacteria bacterium]|nr:5'-3' exonuclease H3TH domain-containing protein [Candidatus Wildermuthbacteria bacterium]
MGEKKRLIVIDSNAIIHRAYHALPPLTTKKGEAVGAVYGFLLVLFKAIREFCPDYIAAAFDVQGITFRHKKFDGYKAKRPKAPEELYSQIPKIKEILGVFGIPVFEKAGFEADDVIGTICELASREGEKEIIIISGDLDVLQLVGPSVKAYLLRRGVKDAVLYDERLVWERYQGLTPRQLVDFKALRGDPSDNIVGVKGIGEKTATDLLLKFGSLENLYRKLEGESKNNQDVRIKIREILLEQKEGAFLSRFLAQIEKNVPLDFYMEECRRKGFDKKKAISLLEEFDFHSLITRLPSLEEVGAKAEIKSSPMGNNLKLW